MTGRMAVEERRVTKIGRPCWGVTITMVRAMMACLENGKSTGFGLWYEFRANAVPLNQILRALREKFDR